MTVHIEAPAEQIWDLVSDVTKIGRYSPETFEAEWLDGATGPGGRSKVPRAREAQRQGPDLLDHVHRARVRPGPGVLLRRRPERQAAQHLGLQARAGRTTAPT